MTPRRRAVEMRDAILTFLKQQPFVPFRLHMRDRSVHEIRHPERVEVRQGVAVLSRPDPTAPDGLAPQTMLSLDHVVRLEPLVADDPVTVPAPNP
jgi:hypothetical protein